MANREIERYERMWDDARYRSRSEDSVGNDRNGRIRRAQRDYHPKQHKASSFQNNVTMSSQIARKETGPYRSATSGPEGGNRDDDTIGLASKPANCGSKAVDRSVNNNSTTEIAYKNVKQTVTGVRITANQRGKDEVSLWATSQTRRSQP